MLKPGRPPKNFSLATSDREKLEQMLLSSEQTKLSKRAEILLLSADSFTCSEVSERVGCSVRSVGKWRSRYLDDGLAGLHDAPRCGRTRKALPLSDEDRKILVNWSVSRSLPHNLVTRAKIVLMSSDNSMPDTRISKSLGVGTSMVRRWRKRFRENGLEGLYDEARSGRKRTFREEHIAELIQKTLESKPEGATHWSCRTMAAESGMSASTVNRVWKLFSIKPHKRGSFKLSTDPFFVDKVVDICGLYLNPPDNAMVLCVDEKSQCQALERTQPILPLGIGYAESSTDNYYRHGVATLFSAFNTATGDVQIACKKRHRHQEFLSFMNQIKRSVPDDMDVHIVLDNYCTHKHEKVRAWIKRNPRFHFHFTPTYSSWLNQVERWFGIITEKAIRRGSFSSVKMLVEKIEEFTRVYNRDPKPFVWTATAEDILEKLERLCKKIGPDLND